MRISGDHISNILIDWYLANQRDLPWRKTNDPYAIWVSEIILQQTRVVQGTAYYLRFMSRFPDVHRLAGADLEEVLKVWQGLGYYTRARNMHAAANQVVRQNRGIFPSTYRELMALKGIGPYTAAAIASIAFNEPRAVVDGNVHRVIARLFGLFEPPRPAGATCRICRQADALLNREKPGIHNQALMEFGALVCTPVQPSCVSCLLKEHCFAYTRDRVRELPVRTRPNKQKNRYFHYLIINRGDRILFRQRTDKDIWQHLFEFPLIETPRPVSPGRLMETPSWKQFFPDGPVNPHKISGTIRHILSHQIIHAKFYHLGSIPDDRVFHPSIQEAPLSSFRQFPVPKLIENYLDTLMD